MMGSTQRNPVQELVGLLGCSSEAECIAAGTTLAMLGTLSLCVVGVGFWPYVADAA